MKDWGFPVGPMALFDEVGIDVGAQVAETMSSMFANRGIDTTNRAQKLLDAGFDHTHL